jgi:DNA-binding transcriptional MocR family regulator
MKRINPYKLFVGCFLPNWLVCRKEISEGAKICYARLSQYAGDKGYAFPFQDTLAEEMGVSDRQIRRRLEELVKYNLIEQEQQGLSRPNVYYFLWHPWMEQDKEPIEYKEPDIDVHSEPDERFRSDRTNGSGQSGRERPTEENHLRESMKKVFARAKSEKNQCVGYPPKGGQPRYCGACGHSHLATGG